VYVNSFRRKGFVRIGGKVEDHIRLLCPAKIYGPVQREKNGMTIPTVIKGQRTGRDFFMKRSSYQFDSLQLSCPTPFPFHSAIHLLGYESITGKKGMTSPGQFAQLITQFTKITEKLANSFLSSSSSSFGKHRPYMLGSNEDE